MSDGSNFPDRPIDPTTGEPVTPPPPGGEPTEPMPVTGDPAAVPPPPGDPTTVMPVGDVPPGGAIPPGGTVPPGGTLPPDGPPPPWYERNAVIGAAAGLLVIALVIVLIVWLAGDDDDDDAIDASATTVVATTFPIESTVPSTSVAPTTVPPTTVPPTTAPPTTAAPTTVAPTTAPPTTAPPTTAAPATTAPPTTPPPTTIPPTTAPPVAPEDATALEILRANPDQFSTLVGLIDRVGLADDLSQPGQSFTIFAPTNDVFEGVDLSALNDQQVTDILLHHVVPDALDSFAVFAESGELETLNQPIEVDADAQTVDGATITTPDLPATGDPDGWVHAIDMVLMP